MASATMAVAVSSIWNSAMAAAPAPAKDTIETNAQKCLRQPCGRKSGTRRQTAAPPRRISSGESAPQSIDGVGNFVMAPPRTGSQESQPAFRRRSGP
jgi:hypothetical protein